MKTKFTTWDPAEYLDSEESIAEYLNAALEENDTKFFAKAVGNVARARSMTEIAKKSGLRRESLYKALSGENRPSMEVMQKVIGAMGLEIKIAAHA